MTHIYAVVGAPCSGKSSMVRTLLGLPLFETISQKRLAELDVADVSPPDPDLDGGEVHGNRVMNLNRQGKTGKYHKGFVYWRHRKTGLFFPWASLDGNAHPQDALMHVRNLERRGSAIVEGRLIAKLVNANPDAARWYVYVVDPGLDAIEQNAVERHARGKYRASNRTKEDAVAQVRSEYRQWKRWQRKYLETLSVPIAVITDPRAARPRSRALVRTQ